MRHAKENPTLRGSRADQETSYLRGSEIQRDYEKLREEKNVLAEENRRLAMLMKDGNKMDLNIVRKENEQLRKEVEALRGQSSVSPSTNEQKLGYY